MTTVASVWTHAQFLDGTAIKGHALGLRIAAGNVPNFVDLQTGGWGTTIQDPLNSGQTPTMANFATLADVLSGCVTRVTPDACSKLFAAATPPEGRRPDRHADGGAVDRPLSLVPARAAVRPARRVLSGPSRQDHAGGAVHAVPSAARPAPGCCRSSSTAAGIVAGGKAMFDSEGNLWVGDNFTDRLAGAGHTLAGQRHQVRPERQAALADHNRLCRRRHARRHLRCRRRRQRQCLVHQLRRQVD